MLRGQIAFVTGASRGIGAGIAEALTDAQVEGLCLTARDLSALESVAAACKARRPDLKVHVCLSVNSWIETHHVLVVVVVFDRFIT